MRAIRTLSFLLFFTWLFSLPAFAGTSTITVLDASSVSHTYVVVTNGSGFFLSEGVICDFSAGANCAGVDTGHSLQVAGEGTAGTPAGGVVSIQGVTSGQAVPISGAVSQTSGPWTQNITQLAGSTSGLTVWGSAPTGATVLNANVNCIAGCSSSGGTSSTFGSAFPTTGTAIGLTNGTNMVAWSAASNYGTSPGAIAVPAVNAFITNANGNGQATMSNSSPIALASDQTGSCTGKLVINQTTSTDLYTSTAKINICSIVLISATAQNLSLVEGTGTVCASTTAGLVGGTTASIAVAANSGFSAVAGIPWLKSGTTADHVCLLQSGSGNVSGVITYLDHT